MRGVPRERRAISAAPSASSRTDRMRAEPQFFDYVRQPDGGPFFDRNGLLFLSPSELDTLNAELAASDVAPLGGRALIVASIEAEMFDQYDATYENESHYLRVYLAQLRRKLEREPSRPRHLITEPGMGYRFEA